MSSESGNDGDSPSWAEANPAVSLLVQRGVILPDQCVPFADRCRDAPVPSFRCPESGVIFLESAARTSGDYYQLRETGPVATMGRSIAPARLDDDFRRAEMFGSVISNKRWLDIGTGSGGILDLLAGECLSAVGVEPHDHTRAMVVERGHEVVASVGDLSAGGYPQFDVATMFHVMEHLHDPVSLLNQVRTRLNPNGMLVVEVPHARDALLVRYGSEVFRDFTMWSEHLILHTAKNLTCVLEEAGYEILEITGVQRYPLANHLRWLSHGEPGGQEVWDCLVDDPLDSEYERLLRSLGETDTIIAIAQPRTGRVLP